MKVTKKHVEKGLELRNHLVSKAWESATFKEQLISNPKETIAEFTSGKTDAAAITTDIVVEDQTDANTIYLNIPVKPKLNIDELELELTEEQLDMVSGGEASCSVIDFFDSVGYSSGAGWGMLARDVYDGVTGLFD